MKYIIQNWTILIVIACSIAGQSLAQEKQEEYEDPSKVFDHLYALAFIPSGGASFTELSPSPTVLENFKGQPKMIPQRNQELREKAAIHFKNKKPVQAEQELLQALEYYLNSTEQGDAGAIPNILLKQDIMEKISIEGLNPDEYDEVSMLLFELGFAYASMGRYTLASKLYDATMMLCIQKYGRASVRTIAVLNNMAVMLYENGAYDEAIGMFEMMRINEPSTRRQLGSVGTLIAYSNYLQVSKIGQVEDDIAPQFKELIKAARFFHEDYPDHSMDAMINVIYYAADMGYYEEAEALSMAMMQEMGLLNEEEEGFSGFQAFAIQGLVHAKIKKGEYDNMENMLKDIATSYKKHYSSNWKLQLHVTNMEVELALAQKQYGQAASLLERAKLMILNTYSAENPAYGELTFMRGHVLWASMNVKGAAGAFKNYLDFINKHIVLYRQVMGSEKQLTFRAGVEEKLDEILSFVQASSGKYDQLLLPLLEVRMLLKRVAYSENWSAKGKGMQKAKPQAHGSVLGMARWQGENPRQSHPAQRHTPFDQTRI